MIILVSDGDSFDLSERQRRVDRPDPQAEQYHGLLDPHLLGRPAAGDRHHHGPDRRRGLPRRRPAGAQGRLPADRRHEGDQAGEDRARAARRFRAGLHGGPVGPGRLRPDPVRPEVHAMVTIAPGRAGDRGRGDPRRDGRAPARRAGAAAWPGWRSAPTSGRRPGPVSPRCSASSRSPRSAGGWSRCSCFPQGPRGRDDPRQPAQACPDRARRLAQHAAQGRRAERRPEPDEARRRRHGVVLPAGPGRDLPDVGRRLLQRGQAGGGRHQGPRGRPQHLQRPAAALRLHRGQDRPVLRPGRGRQDRPALAAQEHACC